MSWVFNESGVTARVVWITFIIYRWYFLLVLRELKWCFLLTPKLLAKHQLFQNSRSILKISKSVWSSEKLFPKTFVLFSWRSFQSLQRFQKIFQRVPKSFWKIRWFSETFRKLLNVAKVLWKFFILFQNIFNYFWSSSKWSSRTTDVQLKCTAFC